MVTVRARRTPNPNAMKFELDVALPSEIDARAADDPDDAFTSALLEIDGVASVFGINDFVTVTRRDDTDWDDIVCAVEDLVAEHLGDAATPGDDQRLEEARQLLRDAATRPEPSPVDLPGRPGREPRDVD